MSEPAAAPTGTALSELFDRDPLSLTDSDLDSMLAWLRAQRQLWKIEEASARAEGRPARSAKSRPAAPSPEDAY